MCSVHVRLANACRACAARSGPAMRPVLSSPTSPPTCIVKPVFTACVKPSMPDVVPGLMKRVPSGSGPIPCGPGPTRGAAHPATATSPNPSTRRLPVISRFLSHVVWSIRVTPSRLASLRVLHRNADAVLLEELFARATHVLPLADRFGRGRQARENRPPVRFRDHAAIQEIDQWDD